MSMYECLLLLHAKLLTRLLEDFTIIKPIHQSKLIWDIICKDVNFPKYNDKDQVSRKIAILACAAIPL